MGIGALLDQSPPVRAAVGAGLGLIAGSFVATVAVRWPQGRRVLAGRSACDACGATLGPLNLVPLLSWGLQRGRCRACGGRIDPRHPAIEAAAAMLGATALLAAPGALGVVSALLGWCLLLIAILDLEHQWLPDLLTLSLALCGLAAAWAGFGPPPGERALGVVIGWAALASIAALYRRLRGREGLGGGDPRLLGALGAWIGALQLPYVLVGAGMLGLVAALLLRLRGEAVTATTRFPLGTLMALAAWPIWLVVASA